MHAINFYLSTFGVINFTQFILGTIAIILLPGPNSLFVLSLAMQQGKLGKLGENQFTSSASKRFLIQAAAHAAAIIKHVMRHIRLPMAAAFGIMVGDLLLMSIASLGAASLLKQYPELFQLVKYMGAAYLLYLAFGMFRQAYFALCALKQLKPDLNVDLKVAKQVRQSQEQRTYNQRTAFLKALGISLLNSKAIFFFIAFFVQFIQPTYQPVWQPMAILMLFLQIISLSYLLSLTLLGAKVLRYLKVHPYSSPLGFAVVGGLFTYFAIGLSLSSF